MSHALPVLYPKYVLQGVLSHYDIMGTWLYKGKVNIQYTFYRVFLMNVINHTVKFSERMNTRAL